jgi:hypothetical protein
MNPIATTMISQNAQQSMDAGNQNMNSMPEFESGGTTKLNASQILSIGIGIASLVALVLTIKYYNRMLKKMEAEEQQQSAEIQNLENIHQNETRQTRKLNFY